MRRVAFGSVLGLALEPRRHAIDFVLDQVGPAIAIDVAFLAVEVSGVVELVALHLLERAEGLEAAFDVAFDGPDWVEGNNHLAGVWRCLEVFGGGEGWMFGLDG
jgi:hypothetical protein